MNAFPGSLLMALCVVLAACASGGGADRGAGTAATEQVGVLNSAYASSRVPRFDADSGICAPGSLQMLDKDDDLKTIATTRSDRVCPGRTMSAATMLSTPNQSAYPQAFIARGIGAAAQLLVLIDAEGLVDRVHALCTTDRAFAQAPEQMARAMRFTPAACDGQPVRSAVLVPVEYHPDMLEQPAIQVLLDAGHRPDAPALAMAPPGMH